MTINEHLVKVSSSSVPIMQALNLGTDVVIRISGSVVKIEDKDNHDGTFNRLYIIKGVVAEEE